MSEKSCIVGLVLWMKGRKVVEGGREDSFEKKALLFEESLRWIFVLSHHHVDNLIENSFLVLTSPAGVIWCCQLVPHPQSHPPVPLEFQLLVH